VRGRPRHFTCWQVASVPKEVVQEFADGLRANVGKWISNDATFGKGETGQKQARAEAGKIRKYVAREGMDEFKIGSRVWADENGNYVFALSYDPNAKPRTRSK
jgi:hypothetical protein